MALESKSGFDSKGLVLYRSQSRQHLLIDGFRSLICAALIAPLIHDVVHAAVGPPPLVPDDGTTYDFYVADQEQYDSNLFRLPSDVGSIATLVSPNASRSDYINSLSLGGDAQWIAGRQILELNLRADENRFARNDELNNTSEYGNLLWNWEVGSHFSGQAGATYNHALANFEETRELGRDLTDAVRYFGNARYQVGPVWAIYGGISDFDISHSLMQAQFNDFHLKQGDAGVELDTGVADTYALEYSYSDGGFPPVALNGQPLAADYHEQLIRFLVKYGFSDKTQIDAYAGYRKRDFTATGAEAFSGDVWRVAMTWTPTDKTQMVFVGWHELRSYTSAESDYFVSKGGSISPVWNATEKFKFAFVFSYENQDYASQSTNVVVLGPLNAQIATEQVNVTFMPRSAWIFNLAFNHTKRNSNQLTYQFGDDLATVSVLYKIH
jgi:hypothetical protein